MSYDYFRLPSSKYKSYVIKSPITTHYRMATCQEIECKAYREGWTYRKSDLERENLLYTVTHAGRRYREMSLADDAEIYLVFEPGQVCFQAASHRITLDRPEFYFAGRGDARSFSHRRAETFKPEDWVDSFANHLDKLHDARERG